MGYSDVLPRVELGNFPTSLVRLRNLEKRLGGPEIWIKRDDQTGLAIGGNKIRKLEYVLRQAIDQGVSHVLTVGGIQSNHVRSTMAAARVLGLSPVAVLGGEAPEVPTGNFLLTSLLADDVIISDSSNLMKAEQLMQERAEELKTAGHQPFTIPLGASTSVGAMGYVRAFEEFADQCEELRIEFSRIYHASGSGGTQAGLTVGKNLLGLETQILGVLVSKDDYFSCPTKILDLTLEMAKLLGRSDLTGKKEDIILVSGFEGAGYAIPSPEGSQAIELLAKTEGILLDPTYTGKAFAALVDHIENGEIRKEERIVFWHTGGLPALFSEGALIQS